MAYQTLDNMWGAYIPNLDMHVGASTLEPWIQLRGCSTLEPWIRLWGCSTLESWIMPLHVGVSIWWRPIRVGVHYGVPWSIPCTCPWIRTIWGVTHVIPGEHISRTYPCRGPLELWVVIISAWVAPMCTMFKLRVVTLKVTLTLIWPPKRYYSQTEGGGLDRSQVLYPLLTPLEPH